MAPLRHVVNDEYDLLTLSNRSALPMSATDLFSVLSPLRAQVESKIREELSGPLNAGKRFIYDSIMPLYLNVTGDSQEYNLEFLPGGIVKLNSGLAANPDATVNGELASLRDAIIKKSSSAFEEAEKNGKIIVKAQTWKGQEAMRRVRELLSSNH
jgi:hypothetical protein